MNEMGSYVTGEDILTARTAWEEARDRRDPPERVGALRAHMESLWRIQANQFRAEFRARRTAEGTV
jgi:hypothetical protein